jgi:thymidylate synthase ThyX
MRVKLVSLCQTETARAAGRPALTPELLAATGARYSRNNEGLDSILAKIDPNRIDQSVDAIFKMIDYGHQSIADMVPVAIFIDGVSAWLAYLAWSWSPQAGGQESSTRYIRMSPEARVDPVMLGIPEAQRPQWEAAMRAAFDHYARLEGGWQALSETSPGRMRVPAELLTDTGAKGLKQVARMRRNYAFDRARYLLPAAVATNLMLVMSARAWATLCQHLSSSPLPEARHLGAAIRAELELGAPRLLRHATAQESMVRGLAEELSSLAAEARQGVPEHLRDGAGKADHSDAATLDVLTPVGVDAQACAAALRHHDNRYAWVGAALRRTAVRFGWQAVAFADIRDLNRHRTGGKYCPPRPLGFYAADDQLPAAGEADFVKAPVQAVGEAITFGRAVTRQAHELLAAEDPTYIYWTLLGSQFAFEHVTTADKFIYEAELRTGTGAHFRYAKHLHDALALWYARFPETRTRVLEGTAEPE